MKDKTKKFAIGALIAALVGYITGILTAPRSGRQTRKAITSKALKARTEAEKSLKQLHSELDKLIGQAKSTGRNLQQKSGAEFAELVTKAQFAKDKAREILSAVHEGGAEDDDLQKALKQSKQAAANLKKFLAKKTDN